MSVKSDLREQALERAGGRCECPWGCTYTRPKLETAHIDPTRMGGSPSRDVLDNVLMLCKAHHDHLDCRDTPNMRRFENMEMMRWAVKTKRELERRNND